MVDPLEGRAVAQRFTVAFFAFISLTLLTTFTLALLMAPARPATLERPGCEQNLAQATSDLRDMQTRMSRSGGRGPSACATTRLYFLEVVKTRAMIALCNTGPDRERELGRLDADVEHANGAIASSCE
jgi:hypothetical protein